VRKAFTTIKQSKLIDFEYSYFYRKHLKNDIIKDFCFPSSDYNYTRKPFPDFDLGIFSEQHSSKSQFPPLVEFINQKKPAGPWLLDVIKPGRLTSSRRNQSNVALHIHAYHPEEVIKIARRLEKIRNKIDIYTSCKNESDFKILKSLFNKLPFENQLQVFPNRGRDISPMLTGFRHVLSRYDIIGHIHTKKSVHADRAHVDKWVNFLLDNLLSSENAKHPILENILNRFINDPKVGLIHPSIPYIMTSDSCIGAMRILLTKLKISYNIPRYISFPMGTMFWARKEILDPLFSLNLSFDQYPEEPLPLDGTMLHAIERIFPILSEHHGFKTVVTHTPGVIF